MSLRPKSAVMTFVLMLSNVPVAKPWDAKCGENLFVLTEGEVPLKMIQLQIFVVVHIATPCLTFTSARRIPVRSREFPRGLPNLPPSERALLEDGN